MRRTKFALHRSVLRRGRLHQCTGQGVRRARAERCGLSSGATAGSASDLLGPLSLREEGPVSYAHRGNTEQGSQMGASPAPRG